MVQTKGGWSRRHHSPVLIPLAHTLTSLNMITLHLAISDDDYEVRKVIVQGDYNHNILVESLFVQ